MRTTRINKAFDSDVDLTALSSRRVTIERIGTDRYRMTTEFKVWKCEPDSFIYRYLRRKKPGMTYIQGNCSSPCGYFWGPLLPQNHGSAGHG